MQHFNQAEDSKRFTKPEVYRRPATNLPGQIGMDYGRPSVGYFAPRNPSKSTKILFAYLQSKPGGTMSISFLRHVDIVFFTNISQCG